MTNRIQPARPLDLGAALKRWRTAMGWSATKAAQELQVKPSYIRYLERGRGVPSVEFLGRARDISGIDLYVMAYCDGDWSHYPKPVQEALKVLKKELDLYIKRITVVKHERPGFY